MENNIPWVEKYRPNCTKNIVLEENNKTIINNIIKNKYFPNILLYGPPGTGKTTTIINLINEYQKNHYGKIYKDSVIHLNASDERGIEVIRSQIFDFIKTKTFSNINKKFVILDEVDYMTTSAQLALKFIVENEKNNIVFILICNYISKINMSIQSYLLNIRFNDMPSELIVNLITNIVEKENIHITYEQIFQIQRFFKSDIRSMINYIQCNINNFDRFIDSDISKIYKKLTTMNNIDKQFNYINDMVSLYKLSHIDLINKIMKLFLVNYIDEINDHHFMFIKAFYHETLNIENICNVMIEIMNIYIKN